MKLDQVIKVEEQVKSSVHSAYSTIRSFQGNSMEFHERIREIKRNLPKGTPRYVRSYIDGMVEVFRSFIYEKEVEFCYVVKGEILSIRKGSPRNYEDAGYSPKDLSDLAESSDFYWIDSNKKWS